MHVLAIGATGFIGPHVVRQLAAQGCAVSILHRGRTRAALPRGVQAIHGDRTDPGQLHAAVSRSAPDVVLDLIAYTEADARALVAATRDSCPRLVVLSSGDVYRNYAGLQGDASATPDRGPLDEDSRTRKRLYPYRALATGPRELMYSYEKLLVERIVRSAPTDPATVLRLPMVYGPGDRQHRLWPYLGRMLDGRPAILLGERQAAWRTTRGYVEDVAAAIARAVMDPRAAGRTYNVGEPEALTEAEWVRAVGRAAGWEGEVVVLPDERLPSHLRTPMDWRYHLATDTRRLREELEFHEVVGRDEGLRRTVAWELANPPREPQFGAPEYAAEDAALGREAGNT
jgi:nucleoside-diphosphate-sugar epimerase